MRDGEAAGLRRLEGRLFWLVAVLLSAGVAWAVWSVPYLPTNDGPQHVLGVHMEAHYADPSSIYREQLELGYSLAGRGFALVYAPLHETLAWPHALRVVECLMALLWGWGAVALAAAVRPERRVVGLLGFAVAFVWPLYMGFFSFALGLGLALFIVAVVVHRRAMSGIERLGVAVAVLVDLVLHPFAAVLTLAVVALVGLTRAAWPSREAASSTEATVSKEASRSARLKREVAWLALSAAPVVAMLAWMMSEQTALATVGHSEQTTFASLATMFRQLPALLVPGPAVRGVGALAVCAAAWVITAKRARRRAAEPEDLALGIASVGLLLVGAFGPLHMPGWQLVSPRLLPLALVLALALLPFERLRTGRARRALSGALVVAAGLSLVVTERLHRRLADGCADAWRGLQQPFQRSFMQLPIVLESACGLDADPGRSEVPYLEPWMHIGSLYAVAHGGSVPYLFAGPGSVHSFKPRRRGLVPVPPLELWGIFADDGRHVPAVRREMLTLLAGYGAAYENIVVFGATAEDRELLVKRGYQVDFNQLNNLKTHLKPCVVELSVPLRAAEGRVLVAYGPAGLPLRLGQLAIDGPSQGEGVARTRIETLCGELWIGVRLPTAGERCGNADGTGRIAVRVGRGGARARCEREGFDDPIGLDDP